MDTAFQVFYVLIPFRNVMRMTKIHYSIMLHKCRLVLVNWIKPCRILEHRKYSLGQSSSLRNSITVQQKIDMMQRKNIFNHSKPTCVEGFVSVSGFFCFYINIFYCRRRFGLMLDNFSTWELSLCSEAELSGPSASQCSFVVERSKRIRRRSSQYGACSLYNSKRVTALLSMQHSHFDNIHFDNSRL